MQAVSLYASSVVLIVLTMIASTTCDTTPLSLSPSSVTPMAMDTTPANMVKPSEAPTQNDEAKVDAINGPPPTRIPATDAASSSAKPPIIHDPSTVKPTGNLPNATMTNANGTMGNKANTDNKNAASADVPEVFVTSLVLLVLRAFFA